MSTKPQRVGSPDSLNSRNTVSALVAANLNDLKRVEEKIGTAFVTGAPILAEISQYLLRLGGKRIRPLLAIVSGKLFGPAPVSAELITAAAGIELIHMATLLHDDIIDESPTRRHQTSAFVKYGVAPSLLAGDFLLARAFGMCAHLDRFVVEATEQACVELTEGEVIEGRLESAQPRTLNDYIWVVERKTASLFALAGAVGAHLSGASEEDTARLREFGRLAGIAFQMVDDLLDITADEDLLGKPSGTDLRQKTPSLVNILWLESGDPEAAKFFAKESITPEESRVAADYVKGTAVVSQARNIAFEYGERAKQQLSAITDLRVDNSVRDDLWALVDFTLDRCQ